MIYLKVFILLKAHNVLFSKIVSKLITYNRRNLFDGKNLINKQHNNSIETLKFFLLFLYNKASNIKTIKKSFVLNHKSSVFLFHQVDHSACLVPV